MKRVYSVTVDVDLIEAVYREGHQEAVEFVKALDARFGSWQFSKPLMDYFAAMQTEYELDTEQ